MLQGSNAGPGWFPKVINEVLKELLKNTTTYMSDAIVFNENLIAKCFPFVIFSSNYRSTSTKLSPTKSQLGATEADFLGYSISPSGISPNASKITALAKTSTPEDIKQLRSLLGGLFYYRKFLRSLAKQVGPLNLPLTKGAKFEFTLKWKTQFVYG